MAQVKKTDTCWLWTGPRMVNGYGRLQLKRSGKWSHFLAARVAWELLGGTDLPIEMAIRHTCQNILCVHPGHMELFPRIDQSLTQRFMNHVSKTETCWNWIGGKNPNGYGIFNLNTQESNGKVYAHRLSYELFVGELSKSNWVLHRCDNPSCVRPEHLFLGDRQDNVDDMVSKRRHRHKFSPEQVRQIREWKRAGRTLADIANELGVSAVAIWHICRGKCYGYVL